MKPLAEWTAFDIAMWGCLGLLFFTALPIVLVVLFVFGGYPALAIIGYLTGIPWPILMVAAACLFVMAVLLVLFILSRRRR